ncbi:ABC transporter ATP-binding protein [Sporomusa sp.]|uniref:ABC transporter ATP-binding protein n=1 Tax=Sporomusa sp. TaxID=2078658 RepID=UPI002B537E1D|nr:ABC transporter ATP-binding protein [Sporomusa sp.]HWR05306.1 ABC transporter ATP-binding protein [Sporomusa sp.]
MILTVDNISCGYGAKTVIEGISFEIHSGDFMCLLGPNGVGKTTLFKTILRLLKIQSGKILLNGENIANWSQPQLAAKIGYVPQAHTPPFPFTVLDVVAMGRSARLGLFGSPSSADMKIAGQALETLSIGYLRDSIYTRISGGERQLVLIARALAQQPEFLIMDEPTSSLDFGNQIRVLDYIRDLVAKSGIGVLMTTHYPNHALRYGSKVAAIGKNGSLTTGAPHQVITEQYLKDTYGVNVQIVHLQLNDGQDASACIPLSAQTASTAEKAG